MLFSWAGGLAPLSFFASRAYHVFSRMYHRRAAIAAGPSHSRQQLLQQLGASPSESGQSIDAFGIEWIKAWTGTHNFQVRAALSHPRTISFHYVGSINCKS